MEKEEITEDGRTGSRYIPSIMDMKAEPELNMKGFRRIKAKFPFTCSGCGKRFPKDVGVYWKRERDARGTHHTFLWCLNCVTGSLGDNSKRRLQDVEQP